MRLGGNRIGTGSSVVAGLAVVVLTTLALPGAGHAADRAMDGAPESSVASLSPGDRLAAQAVPSVTYYPAGWQVDEGGGAAPAYGSSPGGRAPGGGAPAPGDVRRVVYSGTASTQLDPPWGLDRVDQGSAALDGRFTYGPSGRGVTVYVIDTGVRPTHTELAGRVIPGYTPIDDGLGTQDCNDHGTAMASLIAGTTYGVAKDATIVPVRVLNCAGPGSTADIVAGIDWVTAHHSGPSVANLSIASGGMDAAMNAAVARSIAAGVTYVIAAGNTNSDACANSPGNVPEGITVASVTRGDVRSDFSSRGPCVDLFAPGTVIQAATGAADTGTAFYNGTSASTAFVSGAAALYLQNHPTASPAQVTAALLDLSTRGGVIDAGAGSPVQQLYARADLLG